MSVYYPILTPTILSNFLILDNLINEKRYLTTVLIRNYYDVKLKYFHVETSDFLFCEMFLHILHLLFYLVTGLYYNFNTIYI